MIKIVTIDLDGTLFDRNKNISIENIKTIKECRKHNCKIVIATGRPITGVKPVLEKLGLTTNNDYAIIYNGAKVYNVGTNEIVFSSTIDGKMVKELYHESKRLNTYFHAFRENEDLITDIDNPYTDVEKRLNNIPSIITDIDSINDEDKFLKAMMVDENEKVTNAMQNVDEYFYTKNSMVRSATIFLEFLNKNSDKGKALEALAKYLNVDMADTMAIGDAGNDMSMIKRAGIGVAMGNAFPEVRIIADYITSTNEENGVAEALEKFVINA